MRAQSQDEHIHRSDSQSGPFRPIAGSGPISRDRDDPELPARAPDATGRD